MGHRSVADRRRRDFTDVIDAPHLPPELLPRERRYRPETRGAFGWLFRKTVVFGLMFVITSAFFSVLSKFVWLPIGNDEITYISALFFFGLLALIAMRRFRLQKLLAAKNQEAAALLLAGKIDESAKILEENCAQGRIAPREHSQAILLRAQAALRNGRIDQALGLFACAYYSNWFSAKTLRPEYPRVLNGVALCYAIKGELESAEQWRDFAHAHVPPENIGLLLPLDTLVGIRAGRFAIVVQDAEKEWGSAERLLSPAELNALRLLCAFSLSHINQNGKHEASIQRYLDSLQAPVAAEFDYLSEKWPELKTFLTEHQLSGQ